MKILPEEMADIRSCIESAGLKESDFRFVKRQGRIHLFFRQQSEPFRYFRRKATRLVDGKWRDEFSFFIYPDRRETPADGWQGVVAALTKWLSEIQTTQP